eukprot:Amastigsp_a175828_5.p4 type:complete len:173 gc:universal Amastigsp_a175828_5:1145-627(-)
MCSGAQRRGHWGRESARRSTPRCRPLCSTASWATAALAPRACSISTTLKRGHLPRSRPRRRSRSCSCTPRGCSGRAWTLRCWRERGCSWARAQSTLLRANPSIGHAQPGARSLWRSCAPRCRTLSRRWVVGSPGARCSWGWSAGRPQRSCGCMRACSSTSWRCSASIVPCFL